ncbi:Arm DNA-binding domain-containing protein [Thomasclavelia cocleata]|uniref:Arm DNA-binding domain-containing protein n=1 Tax=Thomasclavelia cocleata TaxID=69824 RepID=UPI002570F26B|nr:Arm DNA-binding domain-containing protein [Thomasclavelia cocleata]
MSISKVKSNKYETVYQVVIRYKNHLGMSECYIKSGFIKMKKARKYEKDFIDNIELDRLGANDCLKNFNDVFRILRKKISMLV